MFRKTTAGAALIVMALAAGCSGEETAVPEADPATSSEATPTEEVTPSETEATTTTPTEETTPSETEATTTTPSETGSTGADASGEPMTLIGRIGTEEDPNAFEISLLTRDGERVQSLPAGKYRIEVDDQAEIHNFHIMGEGVDASTGVAETGQKVLEVNLTPGTYIYQCDPHTAQMKETLTVT